MNSLYSRIRLGAIGFINTVPIYYGLDQGGLELVYDVPAALNRAMAERRLDVSPVSSAYYLQNPDKLVLLGDLSVSSPGAVESVIFISRTPLGPDLLDTPHIAVPDDSETSVNLLAHLICRKTGQDLRPWFKVYPAQDYATVLTEVGSALIIGDNALLVQQQLQAGRMEGYFCYDLSTLWKEETGLPFVFAVWTADREWAEANPEDLVRINRRLTENRDRFFDEPERMRAGIEWAAERCTISREDIHRYYTQALSYVLSAPHRQSLDRFAEVIQALTKRDTTLREQSSTF